jgi:hypothetical protein
MGRRRAKSVSGNTVEPFDEPAGQKRLALRVAWRRAPAALPRLPDGPASRDAWRLAARLAAAQRRLSRPNNIML